MKTTKKALFTALMIFAAADVYAASLSIDIDAYDPTLSPTQAGFYSVDVHDVDSNIISRNFTGVDATIAPSGVASIVISAPANIFARDRAAAPADDPPFTLSDLYRDLIAAPGVPFTITLQGLAPNTLLDVSFYAYDDSNALSPDGNTDTFTNTTAGASSPSASVTYGLSGGGAVSFNEQYRTTLQVISDPTGAVSFQETDSGPQGGPVLNGLEVSLVPEPSTALFSLIGGVGFALRRSRNDRNAYKETHAKSHTVPVV